MDPSWGGSRWPRLGLCLWQELCWWASVMLPEHSGAFPALGLAGGLSQALLSWQSLLVLLVFSRSAGFTGSPDMCWWVVQAHRVREHCVALLVCSFLLSLVRLVLWEEDGHGGSARGAVLTVRAMGSLSLSCRHRQLVHPSAGNFPSAGLPCLTIFVEVMTLMSCTVPIFHV